MVPRRRRRFQGLYYHSSPPRVLPMNGQTTNSDGRRRRETDDLSVKLSTIRIWMHEKDIGKLTRVLWLGQGNRLRQQASTNAKVKRFLAAVPYVMNSVKDIHQAVISNSLETLQSNLEPPVPPALVTCRDANGLNLIHKAAGLGHAAILEYLIATWPDGVHETDITGKTPLHWAASAKNNMRCYTLLTQAGCDEEAVDYKMKTPSFYRHKPNEIERAFLTYVPEAPRVSPDIATDWEALSDDMGGGKKLDIRIPEMNGFGRHSNAESNENASEAEMVESGHEDEDATLDNPDNNDVSNEGEKTKTEVEDTQEPIVKENEEPKEEKGEKEENEEEDEDIEKKETKLESADRSEDNKVSKEEKENDVVEEEKQNDEPQDEKQQTQSKTETTENLITHLDDAGNTEAINSESSEQKTDKIDEQMAQEEKENSQNVMESSEEKPSENVLEEKNTATKADENAIVKETSEENINDEKSKETLDKTANGLENSEQRENISEFANQENQENENQPEIELKPDQETKERNQDNQSETRQEENGILETKDENESDIKIKDEALGDKKNDLTNNVQSLANNITNDFTDNIKHEDGDKDNDNVNSQQIENNSETTAKEKEAVKETEGKTATINDEEPEVENKENNAREEIDSKENIVLNIENGNEKEDREANLLPNERKEDTQTEEQESVGIGSGKKDNISSNVKQEEDAINENENEQVDTSNTEKSNQVTETQNQTTASSQNLNNSTENIPFNKQTPPSTTAKTESAEQENIKTEEDENNNTDNETKELEKSTKPTNKDDTADTLAITDQEFKELDKSLEEYKSSEETSLEKNGKDPNDKLMDKVKENATETLNDNVPTTITTKVDTEIFENETNNLATRSETPQTQLTSEKLVKKDESDDEDEGDQGAAENADDSHDKTKETNKVEIEEEVEIKTETNGEQPESPAESAPNTNSNTSEAQESNEKNLDEEERVAEGSITSSLAIEGFVQGDSEDNTVQSQTAVYFHEYKEARIQNIIATGDMEQLAQIVLNGDGKKLLDVEASEPEIQAFLRNVPNYMGKIRRVHEAARSGSLLNLQQSLDRRKFAIAKDEISPEAATPLHVAVLFGNSDIVRYLAARFPETTTITDNDERTALHYAAVINDNGHFYNVLLQLGANPKAVDKMGYTPEDYLSKEELNGILNYGQLLKRFGAEELEGQLLSDQGGIENQSNQENNLFTTEQGKYLADNLADPLIKALTQVAQMRPKDPLQYLANYLQNYATSRNTNGRTTTQAAIHSGKTQTNSKQSTPELVHMNGQIQQGIADNIEEVSLQQMERFSDNADDDGTDSDAALSQKLEERDEHGQSMLHFACARSHRKGDLIHLIEDSKADITYRDELYRTARDVSLQANQLTNAQEIDRYVISLAVVGDIKPFEYFAISGYDHIIDVLDDDETPIIEVVEARGLHELGTYLRSIRPLEELREELHQMIRDNNVARVKEIADGPNGKWLIRAKNYYGRTALHIAILKESVEIVEHFINVCPEALKIGDNLERTALHYAMGTNIIESISRILIQNGAKRTYKDLKGRQPSYYFMNKADILRLQEEEDESR